MTEFCESETLKCVCVYVCEGRDYAREQKGEYMCVTCSDLSALPFPILCDTPPWISLVNLSKLQEFLCLGLCEWVCVCVCVHMLVYMYLMEMVMSVCVCVYVCVCVCVCVCRCT